MSNHRMVSQAHAGKGDNVAGDKITNNIVAGNVQTVIRFAGHNYDVTVENDQVTRVVDVEAQAEVDITNYGEDEISLIKSKAIAKATSTRG